MRRVQEIEIPRTYFRNVIIYTSCYVFPLHENLWGWCYYCSRFLERRGWDIKRLRNLANVTSLKVGDLGSEPSQLQNLSWSTVLNAQPHLSIYLYLLMNFFSSISLLWERELVRALSVRPYPSLKHLQLLYKQDCTESWEVGTWG